MSAAVRLLLLDPILLTVVAVVLALGVALECHYLRVWPNLPPVDEQVGLIGLEGAANTVDTVDALCAVALGVRYEELLDVREGALRELAVTLEQEGFAPEVQARLQGLGEAMLARHDASRVYHDSALVPPEMAAWRFARDRERCLMAAGYALEPELALRFEALVFEAWEGAWRELLEATPAYAGRRDVVPLTAPAPTLER